MTYWKFKLKCKDGGFGWGQTGARAEMCAPGNTEKEAAEFVRRNIPGGWTMKCVGETKETFYLNGPWMPGEKRPTP